MDAEESTHESVEKLLTNEAPSSSHSVYNAATPISSTLWCPSVSQDDSMQKQQSTTSCRLQEQLPPNDSIDVGKVMLQYARLEDSASRRQSMEKVQEILTILSEVKNWFSEENLASKVIELDVCELLKTSRSSWTEFSQSFADSEHWLKEFVKHDVIINDAAKRLAMLGLEMIQGVEVGADESGETNLGDLEKHDEAMEVTEVVEVPELKSNPDKWQMSVLQMSSVFEKCKSLYPDGPGKRKFTEAIDNAHEMFMNMTRLFQNQNDKLRDNTALQKSMEEKCENYERQLEVATAQMARIDKEQPDLEESDISDFTSKLEKEEFKQECLKKKLQQTRQILGLPLKDDDKEAKLEEQLHEYKNLFKILNEELDDMATYVQESTSGADQEAFAEYLEQQPELPLTYNDSPTTLRSDKDDEAKIPQTETPDSRYTQKLVPVAPTSSDRQVRFTESAETQPFSLPSGVPPPGSPATIGASSSVEASGLTSPTALRDKSKVCKALSTEQISDKPVQLEASERKRTFPSKSASELPTATSSTSVHSDDDKQAPKSLHPRSLTSLYKHDYFQKDDSLRLERVLCVKSLETLHSVKAEKTEKPVQKAKSMPLKPVRSAVIGKFSESEASRGQSLPTSRTKLQTTKLSSVPEQESRATSSGPKDEAKEAVTTPVSSLACIVGTSISRLKMSSSKSTLQTSPNAFEASAGQDAEAEKQENVEAESDEHYPAESGKQLHAKPEPEHTFQTKQGTVGSISAIPESGQNFPLESKPSMVHEAQTAKESASVHIIISEPDPHHPVNSGQDQNERFMGTNESENNSQQRPGEYEESGLEPDQDDLAPGLTDQPDLEHDQAEQLPGQPDQPTLLPSQPDQPTLLPSQPDQPTLSPSQPDQPTLSPCQPDSPGQESSIISVLGSSGPFLVTTDTSDLTGSESEVATGGENEKHQRERHLPTPKPSHSHSTETTPPVPASSRTVKFQSKHNDMESHATCLPDKTALATTESRADAEASASDAGGWARKYEGLREGTEVGGQCITDLRRTTVAELQRLQLPKYGDMLKNLTSCDIQEKDTDEDVREKLQKTLGTTFQYFQDIVSNAIVDLQERDKAEEKMVTAEGMPAGLDEWKKASETQKAKEMEYGINLSLYQTLWQMYSTLRAERRVELQKTCKSRGRSPIVEEENVEEAEPGPDVPEYKPTIADALPQTTACLPPKEEKTNTLPKNWEQELHIAKAAFDEGSIPYTDYMEQVVMCLKMAALLQSKSNMLGNTYTELRLKQALAQKVESILNEVSVEKRKLREWEAEFGITGYKQTLANLDEMERVVRIENEQAYIAMAMTEAHRKIRNKLLRQMYGDLMETIEEKSESEVSEPSLSNATSSETKESADREKMPKVQKERTSDREQPRDSELTKRGIEEDIMKSKVKGTKEDRVLKEKEEGQDPGDRRKPRKDWEDVGRELEQEKRKAQGSLEPKTKENIPASDSVQIIVEDADLHTSVEESKEFLRRVSVSDGELIRRVRSFGSREFSSGPGTSIDLTDLPTHSTASVPLVVSMNHSSLKIVNESTDSVDDTESDFKLPPIRSPGLLPKQGPVQKVPVVCTAGRKDLSLDPMEPTQKKHAKRKITLLPFLSVAGSEIVLPATSSIPEKTQEQSTLGIDSLVTHVPSIEKVKVCLETKSLPTGPKWKQPARRIVEPTHSGRRWRGSLPPIGVCALIPSVPVSTPDAQNNIQKLLECKHVSATDASPRADDQGTITTKVPTDKTVTPSHEQAPVILYPHETVVSDTAEETSAAVSRVERASLSALVPTLRAPRTAGQTSPQSETLTTTSDDDSLSPEFRVAEQPALTYSDKCTASVPLDESRTYLRTPSTNVLPQLHVPGETPAAGTSLRRDHQQSSTERQSQEFSAGRSPEAKYLRPVSSRRHPLFSADHGECTESVIDRQLMLPVVPDRRPRPFSIKKFLKEKDVRPLGNVRTQVQFSPRLPGAVAHDVTDWMRTHIGQASTYKLPFFSANTIQLRERQRRYTHRIKKRHNTYLSASDEKRRVSSIDLQQKAKQWQGMSTRQVRAPRCAGWPTPDPGYVSVHDSRLYCMDVDQNFRKASHILQKLRDGQLKNLEADTSCHFIWNKFLEDSLRFA